MARATGRRASLTKQGTCKKGSKYKRKISIKPYTRSAPGKAAECVIGHKKNGKPIFKKKSCTIKNGKLVRIPSANTTVTFCSSRKKVVKKKSKAKSTVGKPCFTKTGLKKSALKTKPSKCPAGSNRQKANKDAATGRKGGYSKKKKGAAARGRR